jgi:hypothetical protein
VIGRSLGKVAKLVRQDGLATADPVVRAGPARMQEARREVWSASFLEVGQAGEADVRSTEIVPALIALGAVGAAFANRLRIL